MERIYLGKGVYRAKKNTMYFEVFTDEQMELMKSNQGGFAAKKVIGMLNKHGRTVFEGIETVSKEQQAVIISAAGVVSPPEIDYFEGMPVGIKHDLSANSKLSMADGVELKRGGGTNEGDIDVTTGEAIENDEPEPFDESFMEAEDDESDGDRRAEPRTGAKTGNASGANKSGKSKAGSKSSGNKRSSK